MNTIEKIESLLNIDGLSNNKDKALINTIVDLTESKLKNKLSSDIIPSELEYIIIEVAIKRYNKVGAEGMSAESVDGHSMNFDNNDFSEFEKDIENYLLSKKSKKKEIYFL